MKIAICLSGAPRHITQSLKSIESIKNTGEVKIFIHTWSYIKDESLVEKVAWSVWSDHEKFSYKDVVNNFSYEKLKLDCLDTRIEYLKKYKETQNIIIEAYPIEKQFAPFCMLYSMNEVEKLKSEYETENNIKFDMIYRMRFDSLIYNPEMLPKVPYKEETLAIPNENDYTGINDQFAYGTSLSVSKYLKTFSIVNLLETKNFYNTENILKRCIEIQNISLLRTNLTVGIH